MFFVFYWQLFTLERPRLRMQFFYSFFLAWALNGTVLAMLLSSAGPCFYGYLEAGADVYADLMAYLHDANESFPIWALGTQEMLWQAYEGAETGIGSGISAMPSMHVSLALLFLLVGLRTNQWAAVGFGVFFAFILVGSVHLAWHYAVDGYVAILTTLLIWRFSGFLVRRLSAGVGLDGGRSVCCGLSRD